MLQLSPQEVSLGEAFDAFRKAVRRLVSASTARRRAGTFAIEILGKRLLSCPTAFAESWRRSKEGFASELATTEAEVDAARRTVEQETGDDREAQSREATAANVVGAWLKNFAQDVKDEIAAIDTAVAALGLDSPGNGVIDIDPAADARFAALTALIDRLLRNSKAWRDDERLLVFTEYKTTLDYLARRLRRKYEDERILTLFGGGKDGMNEADRDTVKQAFNNPAHAVRVLVATDAAAEGLNLQRTARYVLHFDCPWNPSRIEQRNGRVDRHGQGRDVTVHHFVTDQDQDLKFLAHVLKKADEIREDLGSANELFDEAVHRRLVEGESAAAVQADLDRQITAARGRAAIDADDRIEPDWDGRKADEQLQALASETDFDPQALRDTLETAMAIRAGRPQLDCGTSDRTCKILKPDLPGWAETIDDSVRRRTGEGKLGPVARLAFDVDPFLEQVGERLVFAPRPDVLLMHLSHPMLQRALSALTRWRFPGTGEDVSRWTARLGGVPDGAEAAVVLSLEELAVNDLRETFHHWVRTVVFPIRKASLGDPLKHVPATNLRGGQPTRDSAQDNKARDVLDEVTPDLKRYLAGHASRLTKALSDALSSAGVDARRSEDERYRSRMGEVSALIAENTLARLQREIDRLKQIRQQGLLFDQESRLETLDRSIEEKQEELNRRTRHFEEVRAQLDRERDRILKHLLPKRHAMAGAVQVFPVCVEVRLNGGAA